MCVLFFFYLFAVSQQKWRRRRRRYFETQSTRSPQAPAALRRLRRVVTGATVVTAGTTISVDWLRDLRRGGGTSCLGFNWVLNDAADCSVEARQREEINGRCCRWTETRKAVAAPNDCSGLCVFLPSLKAGNADKRAALSGALTIF